VLTAVIALQSVGVVMDKYYSHQANSDHLISNWSQESANENRMDEYKNISTHSQDDCHHCCYCHTGAQLITDINERFNYRPAKKRFVHKAQYSSVFLLSKLRPPIV